MIDVRFKDTSDAVWKDTNDVVWTHFPAAHLTRNLGFKRSFESILYGTLSLKLGFKYSFIIRVFKFGVDIRFYNRSEGLVKIISSKTQNFPLLNLDFKFLQQGGNFSFNLEVSKDLGLDYNYKMEIYIYEEKWFTGFIHKLPKKGTKKIYAYSGFGAFVEADYQLVNETYMGQELSLVVENVTDKYLVGKTHIRKAT